MASAGPCGNPGVGVGRREARPPRLDEPSTRASDAELLGGEEPGAPAAPPASPRRRTETPRQCPAFTRAATVNQSSAIPAFSPW